MYTVTTPRGMSLSCIVASAMYSTCSQYHGNTVMVVYMYSGQRRSAGSAQVTIMVNFIAFLPSIELYNI